MAYYVLFAVVALLSSGIFPRKIAGWLITIILILFAGSRVNIDNDYGMYAGYFEGVTADFAYFQKNAIVELCMYLVPNFLRLFSLDTGFVVGGGFIIFAILGVGLKMLTITKYAEFFFYSVLLYFTNLYFIQEMTTIRAGVSSAICFWALKDFVDKKYWVFGAKVIFAFLFHNSSMFFLVALAPILLNMKLKYYYLALLASLAIVFLKIDIVKLFRLDIIFPRVALYLSIMDWLEGTKVNVFNFRIIITLAFTLLFAVRYKFIANDRLYSTLFRINIVALIVFFALSLSADTFSLRSYELLSVVQILLFPAIIKLFPKKIIIGQVALIAVILFQLYYTVEISGIFTAYKSWLF